MGTKSILADLEVQVKIRIRTDASAAKGIASRTGLGKIRHLEVSQLWLQDKVSNREIEVMKVKGETNIADILTKHVPAEGIKTHLSSVRQWVDQGRHQLMPEVSKEERVEKCEDPEEKSKGAIYMQATQGHKDASKDRDRNRVKAGVEEQ